MKSGFWSIVILFCAFVKVIFCTSSRLSSCQKIFKHDIAEISVSGFANKRTSKLYFACSVNSIQSLANFEEEFFLHTVNTSSIVDSDSWFKLPLAGPRHATAKIWMLQHEPAFFRKDIILFKISYQLESFSTQVCRFCLFTEVRSWFIYFSNEMVENGCPW